MAYIVQALGNIPTFEDWLFNAAAQEWQQRGRQAPGAKQPINIFSKKQYLSIIPIHRKKTRRVEIPYHPPLNTSIDIPRSKNCIARGSMEQKQAITGCYL